MSKVRGVSAYLVGMDQAPADVDRRAHQMISHAGLTPLCRWSSIEEALSDVSACGDTVRLCLIYCQPEMLRLVYALHLVNSVVEFILVHPEADKLQWTHVPHSTHVVLDERGHDPMLRVLADRLADIRIR